MKKYFHFRTKNANWSFHFVNNLKSRRNLDMIWFYLLPTIEYSRDYMDDKYEDYGFDISFMWLFWGITFTRCWGAGYFMNYLRDDMTNFYKNTKYLENRCVCCGEIIPEGKQVCKNCEQKINKDNKEKEIRL